MNNLRVIDNLEEDRLRESMFLKRRKRGKGKLLGPQGVIGGGSGVVVGCAGGVVRSLVARRPLRRQVNESDAS